MHDPRNHGHLPLVGISFTSLHFDEGPEADSRVLAVDNATSKELGSRSAGTPSRLDSRRSIAGSERLSNETEWTVLAALLTF